MTTAIVLLAAGASHRFGGGKLEAEIGGRPVRDYAFAAAERASFDRRIVVTTDTELMREGWDVAVNAKADEGIASSIRTGIVAASDADRAVLALADMPFVLTSHFDALAKGEGVVFTRYPDERSGIPAAFPSSAFERLLALRGDRGASALGFENAASIALDAEALFDIDTPADLDRARAIAARRE